MSRIARVVAVGLPHHITQRGNYRQDIFLEASDRIQYLAWIKEYGLKYGLLILVYCLMRNHVHFIVIPKEADSLARTFNTAHMRYAQYFNNIQKKHGHLWQGRFYSCVLDEPHLILASRYIERNPVRAGLVERPWQWPWSSALFHSNGDNSGPIELGDLFGLIGMSHDSWESYIDSPEGENFLQRIRKHTFTGRPLGTVAFIEKLEERFQRKLKMLPMGRPLKEKK